MMECFSIFDHIVFKWLLRLLHMGFIFVLLFILNLHPSLSNKGARKLSYAEVCQRLAKEPPAAQTPSPSPPASSASQPLQELKVNRVEEPRPNSRRATDKPEKPGDGRLPRQPLRSFRGANGQVRSGGLKIREHQRGLNPGKPFSPHRGARHSGKEQNIPPRAPK